MPKPKAQTTEAEGEVSLLEQAIGATKQTEPERATELLKTLTEEALKGTVSYSKNLTVTFNQAIAEIDKAMSKQLAAVMHNEKFQKLEGSWRGLHHLVMNSETSATLKIRMMNVSKRDLYKDLSKAVEFDQSQTFKKIYENEFGTPGGEPFGALIGDYEFTNHPEDVELLTSMSNVAAASFAPFISAAGPKLFGFDDYNELSKPRDLEKIFESIEYAKVAVLPGKRGCPASSAWSCRVCWPVCPTVKTPSRSRSSVSRKANWMRAARPNPWDTTSTPG